MISSSPRFVRLKNRAVFTVSGPESAAFLQGLITQDIYQLDQKPLIYSCLLTAQGKFLYDFFVRKTDHGFEIECAADEAELFVKKLMLYRLRKKVEISTPRQKDIFISLDYADETHDPRHPKLGSRHFITPENGQEVAFDIYDHIRISCALPDGRRDAWVDKSTLAELNIDDIAVSFTKGCYVGQELTARMKLRGLNKKILTPVIFPETYTPQKGDLIVNNGHEIGDVRSHCGIYGLAVLKYEFLQKNEKKYNEFVDLRNYDNLLFQSSQIKDEA
jgi:tRNA-modifying protein YgfZ